MVNPHSAHIPQPSRRQQVVGTHDVLYLTWRSSSLLLHVFQISPRWRISVPTWALAT